MEYKNLVYINDVCKTDNTVYNYMNGCYIKGNHENNYVWYSGFLLRIMGINSDGTVRLISENNLTSIPFYTSSTFSGSYAEDWLNQYLINNLKDASIISNYQSWCNATASATETTNTSCTGTNFNDLVGLISLGEYNLALGSESYLNNNKSFFTLTPSTTKNLWGVNNGTVTTDAATNINGLRAVINIRPEVIINDGTGEKINPYFLNGSSNEKKVT